MVTLSDCVKEVAAAANPAGALDPGKPSVVRADLSDSELAAPMTFEVALKMRNLGELQARTAKGEIISPDEMAAKYFPLAADYESAIGWVESLGLTVTARYDNHLSFFVQGSVGQVRDALRVKFARVSYLGRECSSAVSAPSVPAELEAALVGVNGLQPHLRLRPHHTRLKPAFTGGNSAPYVPANLYNAYNATGLSETGAGQTIGIIGYAFPLNSDLMQFWQLCGIDQSMSSITEITVGQGPPGNPAEDDAQEIALDVEWSSSIAPGAAVRVYGTADSDLYGDLAFQQVIADLPSEPQMKQISMSYGMNENQLSRSQIQTDAQYFATMAGAGVTIFFSSGDGGSRPDPTSGDYVSSDPIEVNYPASDASVTGVGGTTLLAADSNGTNPGYSETVWFSNGGGSGGGQSSQVPRPTWQAGTGVPAGSQRLVPDVASSADPDQGAVLIYDGQQSQIGGTSWSSPTWAGFCALMNQSRIAAGLGPIGLLNPRVYPLLGSPCFQDITSGSNGDYSAHAGYDECTGVGTPNVGLLAQALSITSPGSIAPSITVQPSDQSIEAGQSTTFSVGAVSFSATEYQWQVMVAGSDTWTNLVDNGTYSGSQTAALTITDATTGMVGDQFECVIRNAAGSVTSSAATLTIPPVPPLTPIGVGYVQKITQGSSLSVGAYIGFSYNVTGPVTYQWYHDGQPIQGAIYSSYSVPTAGYSDAGDYLLVATNPGGSVSVYQQSVVVLNPTYSGAWTDAQQQGGVVYFFYTSPAQILRYDMNAGAWLSPVSLSGTPTAFRTATEGVYVAFGRTTSLYSLDLSKATPLVNTLNATTSIFVNGIYAYLLGTSDNGDTGIYTTILRSNGSMVATYSGQMYNSYFRQVDVSGSLGKVYGWGFVTEPANLTSLNLNQDGTVSPSSGYDANFALFPSATRTFVFPGGQWVADDGGTVYKGSDLSLVGSLGPWLDDLCFLADGSPVSVRGSEATLYASGGLVEVGRAALSGPALRIFANGASVFGFCPPSTAGGAIGVRQVSESQLAASQRAVARSVSPSAASFVPDDSFVGADNQLYLLSKAYESIFVWNPANHQFSKVIPLLGSPAFIAYSQSLNRIYLVYDDNRIDKIDLSVGTTESPLAAVPTPIINVAALDSQFFVHAHEGESSGEYLLLFDAAGAVADLNGAAIYYTNAVYWNPATQAIYEAPYGGFSEDVEMVPVLPGSFGTPTSSPQSGFNGQGTLGPIRFSSDGSLFATGQGIVYNANTLVLTGILGNSLVDAAWLGTTVSSISLATAGSVVQQWGGANYLLSNSTDLPGYPLRIWPLSGNRLLALTVVDGLATMTELNAEAQILAANGPVIGSEPVGQTLNAGSTVVFATSAAGSVSYQWQFNGVNLSDGQGISGATGPLLELTNVSASNAGAYSCVVTNTAGSNFINAANLVVQTSTTPGTVTSLSSRAFVGTGDNILIGGFFVVGSTSRTVLVQAIGPALAASPYNVSGTLQHPALSIHQSQGGKDVVLCTNTGWGSNPVLSDAAAAVYAQPVLQPGSADSEILVTLPPGGYTAEVQGADGGMGVALVAIYELP